ncbi:hypothetical protein PSYJA_30541, partial [Pseudomonas syringae pv. japonica str. M301072]
FVTLTPAFRSVGYQPLVRGNWPIANSLDEYYVQASLHGAQSLITDDADYILTDPLLR